MQIETTLRYQFAPIRLAKTQRFNNTLMWQSCGEIPDLKQVGYKLVQPLERDGLPMQQTRDTPVGSSGQEDPLE